MAGSQKADLATQENAAALAYNAELDDFSALLQSGGVDATDSLDLIDDKESLIGVPFIVTKAVFRPSDKVSGDDYVSLECTSSETDPITGRNRRLVINDSGTGIRRQMVRYLTHKGIIDPGKGEEAGSETRYDNKCWTWELLGDNADITFNEESTATVTVDGIKMLAKKGLRESTYVNDNGEGTTYYLA